VALRFALSTLRVPEIVAFKKGVAAVRRLWVPNLRCGGNDPSGHPHFFTVVVPRHVVDYHPEERHQRFGTPASVGLEEVRNSLNLAA